MAESLYSLSTAVIVLALALAMVPTLELAARLGRRQAGRVPAAYREHVQAVQAAVLGLIALVLAFCFTLALQRWDARSDAVVDEANAIGTAWLRADALGPPERAQAREALAAYLDLRVREAGLPLPEAAARARIGDAAGQAQAALWRMAADAMRQAPAELGRMLFAQSVNELIDSHGRRQASLARHVPELVLWLLLGTQLLAAGVIGHACGLGGHRPALSLYATLLAMLLMVFLILDLDRPRRGFIQVSHASLVELQASVQADRGQGR